MPAQRTPLYHTMLARGAQMFDRPGFDSPMMFTNPKEEHLTTRSAAGLFEIFGQFLVEVAGPDAVRFLDEALVGNFTDLPDGKAIYCAMLREDGGIIDDLICIRETSNRIWVIPAPKRCDLVVDLLYKKSTSYNVHVVSLGYRYTCLSLQGPKSRTILQDLTRADVGPAALPSFSMTWGNLGEAEDVLISRTGFTGELGYELFIPTGDVEYAYNHILERGADHGLLPCGVVSMVSLRLEKRYPIWGRDISEETNPIEAGLGWTIRPKTLDYPGKSAVEAAKEKGPDRMLVLLQLPRESEVPSGGEVLRADEETVGYVTSAGMGYSVGHPLAMGYVPRALANDGQKIEIDGVGMATVSTRAVVDPDSERARG